ncbi:hypothetical protein VPHK392_0024 [Vibrio phage K392]
MKFQIEFLSLTYGNPAFDADLALVLTEMICCGEISLIDAREVLK